MNMGTGSTLKHTRILLKLSGEALCGAWGLRHRPEDPREISAELAEVHALGAQLGLVIGGGNIFRGLKGSAQGMDRAQRRLHGHAGHRDQRRSRCRTRWRSTACRRA